MKQILKMCALVNASKSSPRSCLLLKTLLFLLCIYIKRVTSLNDTEYRNMAASLGATMVDERQYADEVVAYENDMAFDLHCPYRDAAVKIRKGVNRTEAERWRRDVYRRIKLVWRKDDKPIHRSTGDPFYTSDQFKGNPKGTISLMKITPADEGHYQCWINYTNINPAARNYLHLYPSISFYFRVHEPQLLDQAPIISHPPTNQTVPRGSTVVFDCKAPPTLGTKQIDWFASNCHDNQTLCDKFFEVYNKTIQLQNGLLLNNYTLKNNHNDELRLESVNDTDVGYYGCVVTNQRGMDIRIARLDLLELQYERYQIISTATTTTTEPTTTTTTAAATTTVSLSLTTTSTSSTRTRTPIPIINSNAPSTTIPTAVVSASHEQFSTTHTMIYLIVIILCLSFVVAIFVVVHCSKFIRKDKKTSLIVPDEPIVGMRPENPRQHLPNVESPDMYNIGKSSDLFLNLSQGNVHLMSQSISCRALDKEKNPSISSNSNSDEASSLGKSVSYHSDNNRNVYTIGSNTTTTTVPMYDQPPSTATSRLFRTQVQDACVINPTYGLIPSKSSATKWTFPRRNLEKLNKIGEGQFGEVWLYKAHQEDGNKNYVAVKQQKHQVGPDRHERMEFLAEIEIMKLVNDHPNVVKILHYCADDYEPLLLIMEYVEYGKLQTYLRSCRHFRKSLNDFGNIITSKELIKFSYHIAKGMEYIASKGIIHRDLASRNILMSKEKICKVADFGFARRVNDECAYERTTTNPVPVKWMAPEALVQNKFTSKSDVFSFGILMWEIVTLGATPYENLTSKEVCEKVTSGFRLEKPKHCKDEFYQVMASCWKHDPADRPSFKALAEQLEKLLLSENDYIELDQYPEHAYYNILNVAEKEVVNIDNE